MFESIEKSNEVTLLGREKWVPSRKGIAMSTFNEKKFFEVCEEITDTCDCKGGYCFYRNLVAHQHPSLRMLIQVECIEKIKWIMSEREGKDVGISAASEHWISAGFAQKFADVYDENLTVKEIFKRTMAK